MMTTALLLLGAASGATAVPTFAVKNDRFEMDGKPISLLSGSIHYSRIHPDLWADRLSRVRALGLNSITTYVPWNFHEEQPGVFDFHSDWRNLTRFIELAQRAGLLVLLRPGPYMCGEWDFGGLPAWLLANGTTRLRTFAEPYISRVGRFWSVLLPLVEPLLYEHGGPIIMVQMENEYGSYGDVTQHPSDRRYMEHLVSLARESLGPRVLLYTTDGGSMDYMRRGSLQGGAVLTVGDGCDHPDPNDTWAAQKTFNPPGGSPFLCSELYPGWLTHWGERMANTSTTKAANHLAAALDVGGGVGSANLYMVHGGTSFGWWAGANGNGNASYAPDISSYDYDAPISEGGEHGYASDGDKYAALAAVLRRFNRGTPPPPPEPPLRPRIAFGAVRLEQAASLLANAVRMAPTAAARGAKAPPAGVESLGCYGGGFAHYAATLDAPIAGGGQLRLPRAQDRAQVFVQYAAVSEPSYIGTIYRADPKHSTLTMPALPAGSTVLVLLELLGRINYGHGMDDARFGLLGGALLDGSPLAATWTTRCLPLDAQQRGALQWAPIDGHRDGPTFYRAHFHSGTSGGADTYLALPGFCKGAAWLNGFHLGRYWNVEGPQLTLYVPGPVVRPSGKANVLVVLELHNASANATVELWDRPAWGRN